MDGKKAEKAEKKQNQNLAPPSPPFLKVETVIP
jgi:hypothetical protein